MEKEAKDKTKIKILDLLKSRPEGLTITDIMRKIGLARHTVLARLHHLVGQGKVDVRQINMAKLHYLKGEQKKDNKENDIEVVPLEEEHIKKITSQPEPKEPSIDLQKIKEEIDQDLRVGKIRKEEAQLKEQREPIARIPEKSVPKKAKRIEFTKTGVPGLDDLFEQGIPKGSDVLIAGGAGSGKTIFCLQTLFYQASQGKKCLYLSFEESEERLISHMENFGWNPEALIKNGSLLIKRFNPFDITRNIDALLTKAKGELLIDIEPITFPEGFKPEFLVIDSLTSIASAFVEKEDSYRAYIEQLFRFLEQINATSFLITETKQIPTIFSQTGVEEFLADGVIVFYNIKKGSVRENAIEVLKLRGAKHKKKIVAMQITDKGIVVYPEQEVFGSLEEKDKF